MTPGFRTRVATAVLALAFSAPLACQTSFFADYVAALDDHGQAGGGIFTPTNALGAPNGGSNVCSLGNEGWLTLGFNVPITDGPGADLIVSENPFQSSGGFWLSYAEMCFVEVSSNGTDFVRFPSRYYGAPVQPGAFGFVPVGTYSGLAGQTPVLATTPGVDPRDVASAGGDAFDLADLQNEPLVQNGTVQLNAISQVRLVDVLSGASTDSTGTAIFDPGTGSADIDAVTAIHQQGFVPVGNPSVALDVQPDGTMTLRIEDPDGWQDLDPQSLRAALFGLPVDAFGLLQSFFVQSVDATGFTLVQPFPLPPELLFTISLSLKDAAGNRSGQARTRPGS
ncbi:MAG: hypothetical protein R3F29_09910 [Planctomycetota bacterium]